MSFSGVCVFALLHPGLVHPEQGGHHAEHREHHRGTGLHLPAAGTHGEGAGGDHPEVRGGVKLAVGHVLASGWEG